MRAEAEEGVRSHGTRVIGSWEPLTLLLGTKLDSFGREAGTLNHWATSPAPEMFLMLEIKTENGKAFLTI